MNALIDSVINLGIYLGGGLGVSFCFVMLAIAVRKKPIILIALPGKFLKKTRETYATHTPIKIPTGLPPLGHISLFEENRLYSEPKRGQNA